LLLEGVKFFTLRGHEDAAHALQPCRTVLPGHACHGLIDPWRASARSNPEEYERRKAEAYVEDGEDPAPAVVTFTTEAAAMAVNELIQGVTDFRMPLGMTPITVRQLNNPSSTSLLLHICFRGRQRN
jgi:hypothetical protein